LLSADGTSINKCEKKGEVILPSYNLS